MDNFSRDVTCKQVIQLPLILHRNPVQRHLQPLFSEPRSEPIRIKRIYEYVRSILSLFILSLSIVTMNYEVA
jgi:hypothetical protein